MPSAIVEMEYSDPEAVARENLCLQSDAIDTSPWAEGAGATTLTENTNAAPRDSSKSSWTIEDDNAAAAESRKQNITVADDTNAYATQVHILKDGDETRFPAVRVEFLSGSTTLDFWLMINTKTGAVAAHPSLDTPNSFSSELYVDYDGAEWWVVDMVCTNNGTGNTTLRLDLYPAGGNVWLASSSAATGSATFAHINVQINNPGPSNIATTTTAVTSNWFDLTADVLAVVPLSWERGIPGGLPNDLVARPGIASFALNNSASNTGALQGYYSPGHANVRTGFQHGARIRIFVDAGSGANWYVFMGRIKTIKPIPGTTGEQITFITLEDYLAEYMDFDDLRLALVTSQRSDQLIQDTLDLMENAPTNTDLETGQDSYTFAFDDLGGNQPQMGTVVQKICQSERGRLYVRGNATDGETFKFEDRHFRAKATSDLTLTEGQLRYGDGIEVPTALDFIYNDIESVVYPRRVDSAATTVLVKFDAEVAVGAGETVSIFADYRDPSNEGEWVGGQDMVQPVATTDYTANDTSGGGGSDVTSDFTVSASYFGSRCVIDITNNGTATGYLRGPGTDDGMQCRGKGLYRYQPIISREINQDSIDEYGRRQLPQPIDLPYQDDVATGRGIAEFLANLHGDLSNIPSSVTPVCENPTILQSCIVRDIGDKVTLSESLTAVSSQEVFINAVRGTITDGRVVSLTWTLAPSDTTAVFILDDAVAGILDTNKLGYA